MGNRLSRIYTRTGDKGTTGLGDGSRISKSDLRIAAIGDIDELNSVIGIVLSHEVDSATREALTRIQHQLFNAGGELCMPGNPMIQESHVTWLEQQLDHLNQSLQPLKEFILPGGSSEAAYCHLARTVCRRAERNLVLLNDRDTVSTILMQYVNRLSDFLFVLARHINKQKNQPDIMWDNNKSH